MTPVSVDGEGSVPPGSVLAWKGTIMWIPSSVTELRQAVEDGLEESPWLDGKRQLGSAAEAAKDVASMANEGGVLIFGVAEDADGRLAELAPIENLGGFEERIANAVRDLVHNPPAMTVTALREDDDEDLNRGYAVVVVPRSPLAPHLVEGRREGRFYGRTGTTTSRLTGAQIEMLLARRLAISLDMHATLESASHWRHEPPALSRDVGQLTVVVDPSVPSGGVVQRAAGEQHPPFFLSRLFHEVIDARLHPQNDGHALRWASEEGRWQIGADIYATVGEFGSDRPHVTVEVEVGRNGRVIVRSRGAVEFAPPPNRPTQDPITLCVEWVVGPMTVWTLAAAGQLFTRAGMLGQVHVGVRVDGLREARSWSLAANRSIVGGIPQSASMLESTYVRHEATTSVGLRDDPVGPATRLLGHLLEALTQGADYPTAFDPLNFDAHD